MHSARRLGRGLSGTRWSARYVLPLVLLCACTGSSTNNLDAGVSVSDSAVITLASLSVTPATPAIARGSQQAFIATGRFTDSSSQDLSAQVAWSVQDASGTGVATIEPSGVATGRSIGSAVITAAYQGMTATATLQVVLPVPAQIQILPNRPSIAQLTTQQFRAIGSFADNSSEDITAQVSWASTDLSGSNVARINAAGLATSTNPGQATITASYGNQSASTVLQVNNVTLSSIALSPMSPKLAKGLSLQLRAFGTFSDSSQQEVSDLAAWTATDLAGSGVATVSSSGLVAGKSAGTSTISVMALGKTASMIATVEDATLSAVAVAPASVTLYQQRSQQLTATATYSSGSTQDVTNTATWSASDLSGSNVAAINAAGLARGNADGSARITARYGGSTGTATISVIGPDPGAPTLTGITPNLARIGMVSLQGTNFAAGDTVRIAGQLASDVVVVSATEIRATLPNLTGSFGLLPVSVTHPDGRMVTRGDLFRYLSSVYFNVVKTATSGKDPASVATADLNKDGYPDLAVADASGNSVSVILSSGAGTFNSPYPYFIGTAPSSVTTGDWNGDGRIDLAVTNSGSNSVSILLNSGTGTFGLSSSVMVGMRPSSITAGDWNGDGRVDLAVTNAGSGTVSILLGNGMAGFTGSSVTSGSDPLMVLGRDLNKDGKLDLAVMNHASANVSVHLGNGDGTFKTPIIVSGGIDARSLALGDWNGDSILDLAVANAAPGEDSITVRLGAGDGTFSSTATSYKVGTTPLYVITVDLNGDGRLDLATVNRASNDVSMLLGDGAGGFGTATKFPGGTSPSFLATDVISGDNKPDLIVLNPGSLDNVRMMISTAL